jgi:hypothetical protein
MYRLLRRLLFLLPPEAAHRLATLALDLVGPLLRRPPPPVPVLALGLHFPNPVGLAAGFDKNAEHLRGLAGLGFGFLEVGSVTLRSWPGNARPRLFRLPADGALINRMGLNKPRRRGGGRAPGAVAAGSARLRQCGQDARSRPRRCGGHRRLCPIISHSCAPCRRPGAQHLLPQLRRWPHFRGSRSPGRPARRGGARARWAAAAGEALPRSEPRGPRDCGAHRPRSRGGWLHGDEHHGGTHRAAHP